MEADALSPLELGLLLLPLLVTLLAALCVRCRELPGKWGALGYWVLGTPLGPHAFPSPWLPRTVPASGLLGGTGRDGMGLNVFVPGAP